jgi:hypothetical protein
MKRTPSVLLIGLFVLVAMAAPRPAAAGLGPDACFISVKSSGSHPWAENVGFGSRQTALDHRGPNLQVQVWVPLCLAGYTPTFSGRPGSKGSVLPLIEGGRVQGYIYSYSWTFSSWTEGRLELIETIGWGNTRVQHSLWVR